jgi:hypothetical protein
MNSTSRNQDLAAAALQRIRDRRANAAIAKLNADIAALAARVKPLEQIATDDGERRARLRAEPAEHFPFLTDPGTGKPTS